jgi:hypothetical protein
VLLLSESILLVSGFVHHSDVHHSDENDDLQLSSTILGYIAAGLFAIGLLLVLLEVMYLLLCSSAERTKIQQPAESEDDDGFGGSLGNSRRMGRRSLGRRNRLKEQRTLQLEQEHQNQAAANNAVRDVDQQQQHHSSLTKILPVSRSTDFSMNDSDDEDIARTQQRTVHEFQYHEEQLKSRTTLKKHRSMRRTSLRVDARKKLMSSSLLRQMPLFGAMSKTQFKAAIDAMVYLEYESGSIVVLQGNVADKFLVLVDGKVDVYVKKNEHDEEAVFMDQKEHPWYFGEQALLPSEQRSFRTATVKANGSIRLLSLSYETYVALKEQGIIDVTNASEIEEEMAQKKKYWEERKYKMFHSEEDGGEVDRERAHRESITLLQNGQEKNKNVGEDRPSNMSELHNTDNGR